MPDGQDGMLSWAPPLVRAAKLEICVVTRSCPQEGHATPSTSALRRTSFSNLLPQSSHRYSKIGIFHRYSINPDSLDAGMQRRAQPRFQPDQRQ
jgi:hypothetical protein